MNDPGARPVAGKTQEQRDFEAQYQKDLDAYNKNNSIQNYIKGLTPNNDNNVIPVYDENQLAWIDANTGKKIEDRGRLGLLGYSGANQSSLVDESMYDPYFNFALWENQGTGGID